MNIDKVFKIFCDNLFQRKELMTEDNVRYYWFASMLREDPVLEHYTMEYPYNTKVFEQTKNQAKKELDFLYINGNESYCMEIKFHRNPDPKATFAHTDAAGSLFNDIIRLSLFEPGKAFSEQKHTCILPPETKRLFLYVTDEEMDKYLENETGFTLNQKYREKLKEFYIPNGEAYQSFEFNDVPKTFKNSALDALDSNKYNLSSIPGIKLLKQGMYENIESESFKNKSCHIRLYEVEAR
ncbi:MAG: hypothetical protein KBS40_02595 [Bacteroidales bacterium]|nr:hypothetical protein [Bacteroidales bacterium]